MAHVTKIVVERRATRRPGDYESDSFGVTCEAEVYPGDDWHVVRDRLRSQADDYLARWLVDHGYDDTRERRAVLMNEAVSGEGVESVDRVVETEDDDRVQVALSLGGLDEATFHEWVDRLQAEYDLVLYDGLPDGVKSDGSLSSKVWRGRVSVEQYVELSEALAVAGNVYDVVLLDEVSSTRLALAMDAVNGEEE